MANPLSSIFAKDETPGRTWNDYFPLNSVWRSLSPWTIFSFWIALFMFTFVFLIIADKLVEVRPEVEDYVYLFLRFSDLVVWAFRRMMLLTEVNLFCAYVSKCNPDLFDLWMSLKRSRNFSASISSSVVFLTLSGFLLIMLLRSSQLSRLWPVYMTSASSERDLNVSFSCKDFYDIKLWRLFVTSSSIIDFMGVLQKILTWSFASRPESILSWKKFFFERGGLRVSKAGIDPMCSALVVCGYCYNMLNLLERGPAISRFLLCRLLMLFNVGNCNILLGINMQKLLPPGKDEWLNVVTSPCF